MQRQGKEVLLPDTNILEGSHTNLPHTHKALREGERGAVPGGGPSSIGLSPRVALAPFLRPHHPKMVAVIPLDILPLIFEQLLLSCRTPHERKEALYSLKRVSRTFFHEVAPFSELIITSVPQLLCLSNELEDWPAARKPSRLSLAFSQYDWHSIDDREEWDEFRRAKQRIQAQLPDISSLEVMGAFGHEVLAEEWDDTRPTLRRVVIGGSGRFLCDCPRRWLSSFDMLVFSFFVLVLSVTLTFTWPPGSRSSSRRRRSSRRWNSAAALGSTSRPACWI